MIMAQEQAILKGRKQFDEMAAFVRRATKDGRPIDEVEHGLWASLLAMGRSLLEGYVAGHGPGDLGATLVYEGGTLGRLAWLHDRRYVSVFGALTIPRCVYGTRETQKHEVVPVDAWLGLPKGHFSYVLQDWDQTFCVQNSYEPSRQMVEHVLGIGQSVRSLEQMTVSMAEAVEGFRESQPKPPAKEEG